MKIVTNEDSGAHRRNGNTYVVTPEEIEQYNDMGYLVLNDFLTEEEMEFLDPWFDHFVNGKEPGMGKDFCDMSQPYGPPVEEFRLVNAMLPSKYRTELVNNIYFQIAEHVANQLYEGTAVMDYEQFLAKKPQKEAAEFPSVLEIRRHLEEDEAFVAVAAVSPYVYHICITKDFGQLTNLEYDPQQTILDTKLYFAS